jgi:hypothetical protein
MNLKNKYPQLLLLTSFIIIIGQVVYEYWGSCKGGGIFRLAFYLVPLLVFVSIFILAKKRNIFIRLVAAIITSIATYGFLFVLLAVLSLGSTACLNQPW